MPTDALLMPDGHVATRDWETARPFEAWDDTIVRACNEVACLQEAKASLFEARSRLPDSYKDVMIATVFDKVLLGRINAEIEALEAEIAAYRATHKEPIRLPDPVEED